MAAFNRLTLDQLPKNITVVQSSQGVAPGSPSCTSPQFVFVNRPVRYKTYTAEELRAFNVVLRDLDVFILQNVRSFPTGKAVKITAGGIDFVQPDDLDYRALNFFQTRLKQLDLADERQPKLVPAPKST
jgi:hypothetical protein